MFQDDLQKFLGRKRLFRVIRLKGESYKDCVYQLVDNHPECMDALGSAPFWRPCLPRHYFTNNRPIQRKGFGKPQIR